MKFSLENIYFNNVSSSYINGCILRIGSMVMSLYRNKENRGKGGGSNAGITTSVGTPLVALISLLKL